MFEMPDLWAIHWGKLLTREWKQPRKKKFVTVNKDEKRSWRSEDCFDIALEVSSLYFAHLVSGLSLGITVK